MVFAEITNACNLSCVHCPHSLISRLPSYRPRHMELEIYKKLVDEVCKHKGSILRIVCDGEPLLHPQFLEIIGYAKEKGITPICINTNAMLLDEEMARRLLGLGTDVIEISLDALHKDTYEKIRVGGDFEKVVSNTLQLIRMRDSLAAKTRIMVSIIDQPAAKDEIDDFKRQWSPKVDKVITRAFTSIGGLVAKEHQTRGAGRERWPCPLLWTRIFVSVDGLIKFCVEDWQDKTVLFDLKDTSIQKAWNSPPYARIRSQHLSGDFSKVEYCAQCLDWQERDWERDYFCALKEILEN